MQNFNMGFSNNKSDILIHLTQWQYWWWFWFTFLWVLYYLLVARVFRYRTLKFNPRIATTLRPHGKWGDLLTCLIPITWCINILINSNFILKLIEWQSESSLFTLRVRAKQWYWIYKLDLRNISDIYSAPKNIGRNRWQSFTFGDLQTSEDYLHILQMRAYNIWSKNFWKLLNDEHISTDKHSINSPITVYRQEFVNNSTTTLLNNILNKRNLTYLNSNKSIQSFQDSNVFKHSYLFGQDGMANNSVNFDSTTLLKVFLFENAENSYSRIKANSTVPVEVQEELTAGTWEEGKTFWMLNGVVPGNGGLDKELFFNKFKVKSNTEYSSIYNNLEYSKIKKTSKLNFVGLINISADRELFRLLFRHKIEQFLEYTYLKLVFKRSKINELNPYAIYSANNLLTRFNRLFGKSQVNNIFKRVEKRYSASIDAGWAKAFDNNAPKYLKYSKFSQYDANDYYYSNCKYPNHPVNTAISLYARNLMLKESLFDLLYFTNNNKNLKPQNKYWVEQIPRKHPNYHSLVYSAAQMGLFTPNSYKFEGYFVYSNTIKNYNQLDYLNFKNDRFRNNSTVAYTKQNYNDLREIYNNNIVLGLKKIERLRREQIESAQLYVGNVNYDMYIGDILEDKCNTPYYYNNISYKIFKNYLRSTTVDNYNDLTFLENNPEIDDDTRITRRSFGKVAPLRILKKPSNSLFFSKVKSADNNKIELFRFRFNDNIAKTNFKPIKNTVYLTFKQKRYVLKSPKVRDSVKNNKYYSTNPFLKNTSVIEENYGNASKQYRFLKKAKNRVEKTKLSNWNRLLRSRRMLVLPAHVNITVITNSFDIVHSWHIPGLGLKMDCLPGRATHHTLYIDHVGLYYGQCAEVCGRYHHHMPIRVCALPFEHFLLWWNNIGLPKLLFTDEEGKKKTPFRNFTKTAYLSRRFVW